MLTSLPPSPLLSAANGYIFDQFHHSNINQRTDSYGGSLEARCKFTLETIAKISAAIGAERLGVRLAPFGYFNQTKGEQRLEQWTYLCEQLSGLGLAYVHLIEPRFDEIKTENEKLEALGVRAAATYLFILYNLLTQSPLRRRLELFPNKSVSHLSVKPSVPHPSSLQEDTPQPTLKKV